MNFGKLNTKVEIQQYSETRTGSGSFIKEWVKLTDVFAQIIYKTGGESIEADQEQGYNIVEFITRKCAFLSANEKQRILYDGEFFDILYINKINRDSYNKIITRRKTVYQEK